ncbi:heme lyase CcmF/NrfE family subunit [Paucibacter sp. B2R-40]|uniref:heme lyase CcmF/NrfE family subunit n=1 Tax=Paucibacter sp. B2R-40 TaxID=2893554 RepID=UPI0021E4CC6D|nr:heme lyase CcmF/NrfE family subunit [Paucibacter sp. B2R-40]MCV2355684.1 heme lyase CcmF/NrfE family subunit [Paucibacter sp. B2R-40]
MTAELAHLALILALGLAVIQGLAPLLAPQRPAWLQLANQAALAQALCVFLAAAGLVWAFAQNDFSLKLVAAHSNSRLPLQFRVSAVWGSHEGSLLLWITILALWTLAVRSFSAELPTLLRARVLAVLGLISAGFLSFTLLTSNPFERLLPAAPDGRDLNPLLQDPGMIFHPPLLYMGYVGFAVAFAFAIAALLEGRFDAAWARWTRPWTLAAWAFLTGGIFLGSFWAYYELGWGGWWFWDAVENASFMPWLVGTALVHSLAVSEKRGVFKNWTLLLAICAFSLSLLGTFLVRSGVLSSVHAFATDPERGLYILALLVLAIGGSLALFAWRAPQMEQRSHAEEGFALASRETLLLINNLFLLVSAGTVLLGTLYPLAIDALSGAKISVGPPYFDAVFAPLMLPLLALLGFGPFATWRGRGAGALLKQLRLPLLTSVLLGALLSFAFLHSLLAAVSLSLGLWVLLATGWHIAHTLQRPPGSSVSWATRWGQTTRSQWGMWLAHGGLAVFVLGVSLVKSLEQSQEASLQPGQTLNLGGYEFRFESIERRSGPNFIAAQARFEVRREGTLVATLRPEKRFYPVQQMPMSEAAIDRSFSRDLYISLGERSSGGSYGLRVQIKPFMTWIWSGCLLMALGGALAASDRRYRKVPVTVSQKTPPSGSLEAA